MARRDPEWGELAVQNMVEIYLNPENETNWDEVVLDQRPANQEAVVAAEKLLHEMTRSPRQQVPRGGPRDTRAAVEPPSPPWAAPPLL